METRDGSERSKRQTLRSGSTDFRPDVRSREQMHDAIIALYRHFTGNHSIPDQGEYWSYCGDQTSPYSELTHMLRSHFIKASQFVGVVGTNVKVKEDNSAAHPESNWISDTWNDAILRRIRSPGLVHITVRWSCDSLQALTLLAETMRLCPGGTVLILTASGNGPFSPRLIGNIRSDTLPRALMLFLPEYELNRWESTIKIVEHETPHTAFSATQMVSYALHAHPLEDKCGYAALPGHIAIQKKRIKRSMTQREAEQLRRAIIDEDF
jgi:hypothetical protein